MGIRERVPGYSRSRHAVQTTQPLKKVETVPTSASGWVIVKHSCGHEIAHRLDDATVAKAVNLHAASPCDECAKMLVCTICYRHIQKSAAMVLRVGVSRMTKDQPEEFARVEHWLCQAHAYVLFNHMQHTVQDLKDQYNEPPTATATKA